MPTTETRVYPLSPLQEGILVDALHRPGQGFDVEQLVCCTEAELDPSRLRMAWQLVSERHEILLAAVAWGPNNTPLHRLEPETDVPWQEWDWRALPADEAEARFEAFLTQDRARGFSLEQAPLQRVTFFRLTAGCRFVWSFHHLILDGPSVVLVLRDVARVYESLSATRDAECGSTSLEAYSRHTVLVDPAAAEAFWQAQPFRDGAGEAQLLHRPADTGSPALPFAEVERHLSPEWTARLRERGGAGGYRLSTAVSAAWAALLGRYFPEGGAAFGAVRTCRHAVPGGAEMVGMLVTTTPVSTRLDPGEEVGPWLRALREQWLAARPHLLTPLPRALEWAGFPRGVDPFESLVIFESGDLGDALRAAHPVWAGARFTLLERPGCPLVLTAVDGPALRLRLGYDSALVEPWFAEQMAAALLEIMERLAAGTARTIGELQQPAGAEVEAWSRLQSPRVSFEEFGLVPELILSRCKADPEAVAAECGDRSLTYGELGSLARALAARLRAVGASTGTRVAVAAERRLETLVSLLAVLLAGGAYVALDPNSGLDRLELILEDSGASVFLTFGALAEWARARGKTVLELKSGPAGGVEEQLPAPGPQDAAYVIYTSGTTGIPQGVVVPHHALRNHNLSLARRYGLQQQDRVLQFCSLAFDVSLEEILTTWTAGGTVVMAPASLVDPPEFDRFLSERRITAVNLPTAFWHEWAAHLEQCGSAPPPSVRLVVTGTEQPSRRAVEAWRALAPGVRWINAYGPTEATITCTLYEPDGPELPPGEVPIGAPIDNVFAAVIDPQGRLVPPGVAGELCIGGDCLAIGYLHRPELTAQRFVHLSNLAEGRRLYRTGDGARLNGSGMLEFLGRLDDQVKIRGFRVEPSEVESVLLREPQVKQAAVLPHATPDGLQSLIAYVSLAQDRREEPEFWPSVGEYPVYDELLYHAMTEDRLRVESYRRGIQRYVPGKTVVEIGTGKDLILARLCIEAGARKVYAIEGLEHAARAARQTVQRLGLGERIEIIHGYSTDVELPEAVDVSLSEIIGTIGSSEGAWALIEDSKRFLKPGGRIIPGACATRIAAVRLPSDLRARPHFSDMTAYYAEKVFEAMGGRFDLRVCVKNLPPEAVCSDSDLFEDLRFDEPAAQEWSREITLTISDDGPIDGFLLWINLVTAPGNLIDSWHEQYSWLPVFLPAFWPGLDVRRGDRIQATCTARLSTNGVNPDYLIEGVVVRDEAVFTHFRYASPYFRPEEFRQDGFYRVLWNEHEAARPGDLARGEARAPSLRASLAGKLPDYMVPRRVVVLPELPLNASGKIDRRALLSLELSKERDPGSSLRPRDELERRVAELWEEVLGTRGIGISDSFFDLGGHSLLAVRLLARVRKTFQRDLPLAVLFQDPTVAGMAGFLRKNAPPPPWSSLVVLQPAGWRPPLFIATGGAAMLYRSIAQHLAPDQPVYGLQGEDIFGNRTDYPGVEEIARAYIEEMRQVAPEGPYHLAGWSFGGMIAFEMACQLREMGEEVAHLGLIEAYAPGYPRFPALPGRLLWHAGNVLRMKPDARRVYLRDRFKGAASMLWRNLFYVARKSVRRLDTPLPTGLRNSVWTADLQAADYQPRVYTGRIDLFRAEVQPEGCKTDPYLGWGSLAEAIQVWECPGRHGNIGLEPNVAHLAQAIRQALDTVAGVPDP